MTQAILEPMELRVRGFEVLVAALGWVNAVRFLQQFESSRWDYTRERETILPPWGAGEMVGKLKDSAREQSKK
jgi:hypothetical protein